MIPDNASIHKYNKVKETLANLLQDTSSISSNKITRSKPGRSKIDVDAIDKS
ncbi:MAG TPA: hypothetical protein VN704_02955 [Verrucomicrobiae bacterium]|nr:hypothetical protein [Verrucomicrobiae bacterium]